MIKQRLILLCICLLGYAVFKETGIFTAIAVTLANTLVFIIALILREILAVLELHQDLFKNKRKNDLF